MDDKMLLDELNKFTRREHTADEVYIFPVTLCDNEIDRDNERFSRKSLETLAEKFIGVTGIFDHDPKGGNQTARVFMTEVTEEDRNNSLGEKYACLKGYAYMIRTDKNADLIREIDGGIKKEVSVSCAAEKHVCSVCGADRKTSACKHIKGKVYDGKKCYVSLEDISDAYEWSFVAVPAQVRAGVTKSFDESDREELEKRIISALEKICPDGAAAKVFESVKDKLENEELEKLCEMFSAGKAAPVREENWGDYMMSKEGLYGGT